MTLGCDAIAQHAISCTMPLSFTGIKNHATISCAMPLTSTGMANACVGDKGVVAKCKTNKDLNGLIVEVCAVYNDGKELVLGFSDQDKVEHNARRRILGLTPMRLLSTNNRVRLPASAISLNKNVDPDEMYDGIEVLMFQSPESGIKMLNLLRHDRKLKEFGQGGEEEEEEDEN